MHVLFGKFVLLPGCVWDIVSLGHWRRGNNGGSNKNSEVFFFFFLLKGLRSNSGASLSF